MDEELFAEFRERLKRRMEGIGFNHLIGLKMVEMEEGTCTTELEVGPQHINANGWLHGGVITAMCDATAGVAAATSGYRTTTVNMTTEFMRKGPASGKVICRTQVVKKGRTLIWVEAKLYDETEKLLSQSTFVFYCLDEIRLDKLKKSLAQKEENR